MNPSKKASAPQARPAPASSAAPAVEIDKVVVITRQTRLEESIKRFNTIGQARYYVESRGLSFDDYVLEYDNYQRARDAVVRALPAELRFQVIDRSMLPNFLFGPGDLALTLGQDGLVVNAAKYLNGQPVLALNPDPDRFDGVLLPFLWNEAGQAVGAALDGRLGARSISMGRADMNDGQSLHAFNDFFIGANSHVSARYTLQHGVARERHSSSGVIVSTPAGSTGWLSSLYNMAAGISAFASGGREAPPRKSGKRAAQEEASVKTKPKGKASKNADLAASSAPHALAWEDRRLVFMVREPFRSQWSGADLVAGEIGEEEALILESHMPEGGVIFSDGMLDDFLQFNSGTSVQIRLAEKRTRLLVPRE